MGWAERNLHTLYDVAPGLFAPSAYDYPDQKNRHVMYLGGTGSSSSTGILHELYAGTDDAWTDQNLMDKSGGPHSATAPEAFVFILEGTQHVLYLDTSGDGHIRELYWDSDGWHNNDLTANTSSTPAAKAPFGFAFETGRAQVVTWQGTDRHVHAMTRQSSGDIDPNWVHKDLTALYGGPLCARAPGGYAFETGGSMHIDYLGDDGRIYEYVGGTHLTFSAPVDIGAGLDGPDGFADDAYHGYAFQGEGTRHLDVVDTNGDVWEYSYDGSWSVANLTKPLGAPTVIAGTTTSGYVFESTTLVPVATQHVVYAGNDHLVHELWRDPSGWHQNPLTSASSPRPGGSPSGFAELATSTQNVFYISEQNEVVELHYTVDSQVRGVHRPR